MKIRVSCSHRDEDTLERRKGHLSALRRDGRIEPWHNREIRAGGDLDEEISEPLHREAVAAPEIRVRLPAGLRDGTGDEDPPLEMDDLLQPPAPRSALGGKPPALVCWQRNAINQPGHQEQ
ncbi:hypothetical protein [Stappia stellulata]|uniref:hypothetical protein n=1 Tax=Stappia stellulata TaxID=71235 RepID=UPI0012EB9185|nr:hypothetical protein [Stappia stellulata]